MIEEMNAPPPSGRRVALLIGIDRYERGVPTLCNAVRDIEAVGQVLREGHGYQVELVRDEQATCQSLRARIGALTQQLEERDRLILYFAGHGLAEELRDDMTGPQGYILLHDADASDSKTFMAMTELRDLLSGLRCRHLLLLLDCCFAGAFRWSQNRNLVVRGPTLYRERYERYLRDPAWQVITSAAADERAADWLAGKMLGSRDAKGMNSPFAEALCAALGREVETTDLRVGGQRGDGVILASELHLYIDNVFTVREKQQKKALQKPQIWSICGRDKGQFMFDVPGRTPSLPSALALHEQNNPYRGLQIYREADTALFFGRKKATDALFAQVKTSRLLLVSGASGTGKSSLVRAGLVPLLKSPKKQNDQKEEKEQKWKILESKRPGTSAQSMFGEWAEELEKGSGSLPMAIERWRREHGEEKLFLFIDQLEELITLGSALSPFQSSLSDVLRAGDANVCVVMTLRSDFEPHFEELTKALPVTRFPVPPLSLEELRDVIELPASDRVLYFDPPQIVDKLLREVADTPAPLPLLSFVLSEMYRAALLRPLDRTLSERDYQSLGGVSGALSKRADAIYESYKDPAEQASFRYLMLRMVVPGELARRRVLESELVFADPAEQQRIDRIKKRLIEERLLLVDTDGQKQPFVEPAHDKLVMGWAQLRKWIAEDTAYALQHSVNLAQRGHEAGGQLWTFDSRRAQAAQALRKTPQRWNRAEADFIRRSQRLFFATWGVGAAVVLFVLSALSIWLLRERRTSAELLRINTEVQKGKEEIHQQLMSAYIDRGQPLLFQAGTSGAGLLWLHRAQEGNSNSWTLPHLLKSGMKTVDATQAVLVGHKLGINAVAFSPDRRLIATAGGDRTLNIWDAGTGRLVRSIAEAMSQPIKHVAFSPDGRRILTAHEESWPRIHEVESGRVLAWLRRCSASFATWSPDGRRVVTTSEQGKACIYDADNSALLTELVGDASALSRVAFSPDGKRVITVSIDGTIRVFPADGGNAVIVRKGRANRLLHASFSPDGHAVLTIGEFSYDRAHDADTDDGTVQVVPLDGARPVTVLKDAESHIVDAAFRADGQRIVTVNDIGHMRIWAREGGTPILTLGEVSDQRRRFSASAQERAMLDEQRLRFSASAVDRALLEIESVRSAAYSPDGRRIVTTSDDGAARLWDADRGWLLADLRGHGAMLRGAWFYPDGQRVITASDDGTARVWAASARSFVGDPIVHGGHINQAAYVLDGRRIVTAGSDDKVKVWDVANFGQVYESKGPARIAKQSISSDGLRMVIITGQPVVQLLDLESLRSLAELDVSPYSPDQAALSPDGQRIVIISHGEAVVFDVASKKQVASLEPHPWTITSAAFSPDGRSIVTACLDQSVRLFDASTGKLQGKPIAHEGVVRVVAFHPDGKRIITGCDDKSARVFDVASRSLLLELKGHERGVMSAAFSRDGQRIITATEEDAVRVWAADDGRLLTTLRGHGREVVSAAFHPDGSRVVTASRDGLTRIWDVSPESRSADRVGQLLRCYVPARFDHEGSNVIVAAPPDPTPCQGK